MNTAAASSERSVVRPTLSVVIPSYNRCVSLRRAICALYEQEYPLALVEVIVVLDGGSDDSAVMLAGLQPPFRLSVLQQPNQGSAAARNHGAARASGEVLVFLDDDMEASPSFLLRHAEHHASCAGAVVLGYFEAEMDGDRSYFADQLRGWWADMFRRMRAEGHRYAYTDLLSGNFSVSRSLFQQVGGFNETLVRHHDYELGYRLLLAGAEFRFVEAAASVHHERSDVRRLLRGKLAEGMDDVQLGRLHPSLKPVLPMNGLRNYLALPSRILMHLAFRFPALGDRMACILEGGLTPLERARRYATWLRVLSALNIYWYWRGIGRGLPSIRKLNEFLSSDGGESKQEPELIVHLEEGVAAAAACLDQARPAAAALFYRERLIGRIPALAGTERLRGRHLKPILWEHFHAPLLDALAQEHPTGIPLLDQHLDELARRRMKAWTEPPWRV